MKPPGNAPTIVSYGNATKPFVGAPFAIEHRIGIGSPTLSAPSLTTAPRMPLIEKITPRSIHASAVAGTTSARGLAIAARATKQGINTVTGYGNMFFQRIGTPLLSAWNGGPKTTRAVRNSNYAQK